MSEKQVQTEITADASQFEAVMRRVSQAGQQAFKDVERATEPLKGAFEKVNGVLLAMTAILAGGAVFKEAIDETVKFTGEANQLAKKLGVTATEASVLNVALGDVHSNAETFASATDKLTKQVRTNESALNDLGLVTRDAGGHLRNSKDLMLDAIQVLNEYKEGTDRNLAAQVMFGKGAADITPLLKLNKEVMEEAEVKAHALGLVIGVENVQATLAYRAAMNDVHDVLLGLEKAVGDALLPVLTDLGKWFSDIGPTAVIVMKGAIGGLVAAFYGIKMVVDIVWEALKLFVQVAVIQLLRFAETAYKALTFDFSGAKAAWERGGTVLEETLDASHKRIFDKAAANQKKLLALFSSPTEIAPKDSGGKEFEGKGKKENRVSQWELDLEEQRAAHEVSHAEEQRYWGKILETQDLNATERLAVEKKFYTAKAAARRDAQSAEFADLKSQEEKFTHDMDKRLEIAQHVQQEAKRLYGEDSKQYQEASKEIASIEKKKQEQLIRIAQDGIVAREKESLDQIAFEERMAQLDVQAGLESQSELLQQQAQFEDQRYQIQLSAMQDHLALLRQSNDQDIVEIQNAQLKIEELQHAHALKSAEIERQKNLESMSNFKSMVDSMEHTWASGIAQMLQGQLSFHNALRGLWTTTLANFIQYMVAQPLAQYLAGIARSTAAHAAGLATKQAMTTTAAAAGSAAQATADGSSILKNAYTAASGAYSSASAIPYIGWIIAPAAGVAAFAAVAAFGSGIASAESGYDIPAGINPVTQLHQREMVLPSKHADVIRSLADNGGASRGDMHVHVHAMDTRSVVQALESGGALRTALTKMQRNMVGM